jgi:ATP-dependent helicase/nuclease subunit B
LAEAVVPEDVLATLSGDGRRRTARARRWIDLQLPLYRELLRGTHGPDVGLGYVVLPAALGKTAFATWDGYNDRLHEQAMACARTVVERIRKGVFWPPSGRPPPSDAFEDLLLGNAQATIERPCDPWTAAAAAAGEAGR